MESREYSVLRTNLEVCAYVPRLTIFLHHYRNVKLPSAMGDINEPSINLSMMESNTLIDYKQPLMCYTVNLLFLVHS